jgi:hypothetical protein
MNIEEFKDGVKSNKVVTEDGYKDDVPCDDGT